MCLVESNGKNDLEAGSLAFCTHDSVLLHKNYHKCLLNSFAILPSINVFLFIGVSVSVLAKKKKKR